MAASSTSAEVATKDPSTKVEAWGRPLTYVTITANGRRYDLVKKEDIEYICGVDGKIIEVAERVLTETDHAINEARALNCALAANAEQTYSSNGGYKADKTLFSSFRTGFVPSGAKENARLEVFTWKSQVASALKHRNVLEAAVRTLKLLDQKLVTSISSKEISKEKGDEYRTHVAENLVLIDRIFVPRNDEHRGKLERRQDDLATRLKFDPVPAVDDAKLTDVQRLDLLRLESEGLEHELGLIAELKMQKQERQREVMDKIRELESRLPGGASTTITSTPVSTTDSSDSADAAGGSGKKKHSVKRYAY